MADEVPIIRRSGASGLASRSESLCVRCMDRIDLAHEAEFRLGRLTVRPGLRQLVRDDGTEEVVEPRVMQVLVALARTPGAILSRDDLTASCWEGRVVGEDAINRVISRLRRVAEGIGEGDFRIETVTKVGYRLIPPEGIDAPARPAGDALAAAKAEVTQLKLDRRAMFIGAGLALSGAGGVALWRHWAAPGDAPPADIAPLLEQARLAARQGTADGMTQASGLLRRATEIRPDYADGWGLLAINYASLAGGVAPEEETRMQARAAEAIRRATALEPRNPFARFASAMIDPRPASWRRDEMLAREILAERPRSEMALNWLGGLMSTVGRNREAAALSDRVQALRLQPDPGALYSRAVILWSADRLDEADKASAEAITLFPRHFGVWFSRYYMLMYTGRPAEALAMSRNLQARPAGYSDENFAMIDTVAGALLSGAAKDAAAAVALAVDWAHRGAGFAENSLQFCAALGDVGAAFRVAEAYYFGRGFQTGDNRYEPDQRVFTRQRNRRTKILFAPSTANMRRDPRFEALVTELGLAAYWRESRSLPDYRKG